MALCRLIDVSNDNKATGCECSSLVVTHAESSCPDLLFQSNIFGVLTFFKMWKELIGFERLSNQPVLFYRIEEDQKNEIIIVPTGLEAQKFVMKH